MNRDRIAAWIKRDGFLLLALLLLVLMCVLWDGSSAASDSTEARVSRVLSSMAGAGKVEVVLYCEDSTPCGAVVVADGAEDMAVQLRLSSAVSSLLGLEPHRIAVYDRQEEK